MLRHTPKGVGLGTMTNPSIKIIESTGHGKNVAGGKKTSTIQVRDYPPGCDYYLLKKQFRFTVGDAASRMKAEIKAEAYAATLLQPPAGPVIVDEIERALPESNSGRTPLTMASFPIGFDGHDAAEGLQAHPFQLETVARFLGQRFCAVR